MSTIQSTNKKRSRILSVQKKNLVAMIQNFFIRTVGHHSNVNFDDITEPNWERMASILNSMGPSKSANQWKSTFYFMRNRIHKKVELVRQCGASPKDNLSELDLKIYELSPIRDYGFFDAFYGPDKAISGSKDPNTYLSVRNVGTPIRNVEVDNRDFDGSNHDFGYSNREFDDYNLKVEDSNRDVEDSNRNVEYSNCDVEDSYREVEECNRDIEDSTRDVDDFIPERHGSICDDYNHSTFSRVFVAGTSEELELLDDDLVIEENEINLADFPEDSNLNEPTNGSSFNSHQVNCSPSTRRPSSAYGIRVLKDIVVQEGRSVPEWNVGEMQYSSRENYVLSPTPSASSNRNFESDTTAMPVQTNKQRIDDGHEEETTSYQLNESLGNSKTNVRIPEIQKERLVQLVQNNFLKAVGRFAGSNGTFIKANLWQNIAKELNNLGPPRKADQWKTVFNSIKSAAKAKLANAHNNANGLALKPLTRLEEKIVSIYGMDTMDGHQNLGESGFQYKKTVPVTSRFELDFVNRDEETEASVLQEIIREIRAEPEYNSNNSKIGSLPTRNVTIQRQTNSALPGIAPASSDCASMPRNTQSRLSHASNTSFGGMRERELEGSLPRSLPNRLDSGRKTAAALPRRALAPPLRTFARKGRNIRGSGEIENITNINQFFDDDDEVEEDRRSARDRAPQNNVNRDRSNLRNKHTSYEMVQESMNAQERLIGDTNRNHSEMMHLNDRNHLETVGMFTSALHALTDVVLALVNKP